MIILGEWLSAYGFGIVTGEWRRGHSGVTPVLERKAVGLLCRNASSWMSEKSFEMA